MKNDAADNEWLQVTSHDELMSKERFDKSPRKIIRISKSSESYYDPASLERVRENAWLHEQARRENLEWNWNPNLNCQTDQIINLKSGKSKRNIE